MHNFNDELHLKITRRVSATIQANVSPDAGAPNGV